MPAQTASQIRKLVVFVTLVVALLAAIWHANRTTRDQSAAQTSSGSAQLREALQRLAHLPDRASLTMNPGPVNERQLRHVNAPLVGKVDVLVLGQSDADHMSQTFFRKGVRFYNGFLSNSFFAYHFEVFDDIVRAGGVPRLVLYDARCLTLVKEGDEPGYDTPPQDPIWWAGAPFRHKAQPQPPWYRDLDSLLSLQQTELTLQTWQDERQARQTVADLDKDTGASFRVVDRHVTSKVHRWLADGSRVYPGELDGVLSTRGSVRIEDAQGERKLNPQRAAMLEAFVRRMAATGTTVVLYSPPIDPRALTPGLSLQMAGAGRAAAQVANRLGVDYCDLTLQAREIGCQDNDFYDQTHLSRACNRGIVHKLVSRCAPKTQQLLRDLVAPDVLVP
jgi:hypothetical protein